MFNRFKLVLQLKNVLLYLRLILPARRKQTLTMLAKVKINDALGKSKNLTEYPRGLLKPQIRNRDANCSRNSHKPYVMNTYTHLEYSRVFNHGH